MRKIKFTKKLIAIGVATMAISLNLLTFISAYPLMFTTFYYTGAASDFSAYYIGAWRLLHNPERIYYEGAVVGDYPIQPKPATYKYAPSFLIMIVPLLLFDYDTSLLLFNIIQFLLLPIMALLLHKMYKDRHVILTTLVLLVVLIQPFPGLDSLLPTYRWTYRWELLLQFIHTPSLHIVQTTFSSSYYWQWAECNAKVLQTFLLLMSFYLGYVRKPYFSGAMFALALFDPRFALLSIPLVLLYNKGELQPFLKSVIATLVITNSFALYDKIAIEFLQAIFTFGIETPMYFYAWIPFYSIIILTIADLKQIVTSFHGLKDLKR